MGRNRCEKDSQSSGAGTESSISACGYEESSQKWFYPTARICANISATSAMAAAKAYKKKPIDIANAVVEQLTGENASPVFSQIVAVMPGLST